MATCSLPISGNSRFQWRPLGPHAAHWKGRATLNRWRFAGSQNRKNTQREKTTQNCRWSLSIGPSSQRIRRFLSTQSKAGRSPSTHNRTSTEHWRCFATTEGGEEGSESKGGELEFKEEELDLAPAYKRLLLEKKKPGYVGRALRAGKGALVAELLQIFGHLLERPYGGGESVANAGVCVIERVVSDAQALRGQEGVSDQIIFEMLKVVRLLELDMDLVRAARKEETLLERLETAKAHCY